MIYLQIYVVVSMFVSYIYLKSEPHTIGKPIALTAFVFGWIIFPSLIYGFFKNKKWKN
jgi:hypothetical protein